MMAAGGGCVGRRKEDEVGDGLTAYRYDDD
jgi:hypothetical protein